MTTPSLTRYECYSKCSRRGRGEQNTIELEDYAFKLTYLEKYKMKVSLQLIFSKKKKREITMPPLKTKYQGVAPSNNLCLVNKEIGFTYPFLLGIYRTEIRLDFLLGI